MSDLHPSTPAALPFAAFAASSGFRSDRRYALAAALDPAPAAPEIEPADPVATAFAEGYLAGTTIAQAEAEDLAASGATARQALALAIVRLDHDLAEELRLRLRDTVAALCEAAIAPLALDEAALMRRIECAVAMLSRADDERLIRLNPADVAFLSPQMLVQWTVQPDPALERGAIRIESSNGGIEDGPEQWRRAIQEALHQC